MSALSRVQEAILETPIYKAGEVFTLLDMQRAIHHIGYVSASLMRQNLNHLVDMDKLKKTYVAQSGNQQARYQANSEEKRFVNSRLLARVPPECKGFSPRWC